jgi:hypothetical protein
MKRGRTPTPCRAHEARSSPSLSLAGITHQTPSLLASLSKQYRKTVLLHGTRCAPNNCWLSIPCIFNINNRQCRCCLRTKCHTFTLAHQPPLQRSSHLTIHQAPRPALPFPAQVSNAPAALHVVKRGLGFSLNSGVEIRGTHEKREVFHGQALRVLAQRYLANGLVHKCGIEVRRKGSTLQMLRISSAGMETRMTDCIWAAISSTDTRPSWSVSRKAKASTSVSDSSLGLFGNSSFILWKFRLHFMEIVPSARSISASFCLSQRLCMVLRNSSTVIKPLPSASNS